MNEPRLPDASEQYELVILAERELQKAVEWYAANSIIRRLYGDSTSETSYASARLCIERLLEALHANSEPFFAKKDVERATEWAWAHDGLRFCTKPHPEYGHIVYSFDGQSVAHHGPKANTETDKKV